MNLPDRRAGISLAFAASTLLTAGCHHKESDIPRVVATATPTPVSSAATDTPTPSATVTPAPTATPTPTPTPTPVPTIQPAGAMTTFSVNAGGGSVTLASSGYGGVLSYPGNNATTASGSFTLSTVLNGAMPAAAPYGTTPFLYYTMQLSNSVTFVGNFATSPVTLPTSISTAGVTFVETLYDQTMGIQVGNPITGAVNGQSVTFGSVTSGSFAASAGDVYLFVISETGAASPTSTATPASTVSPSGSGTPFSQ